MLLRLRGPDGMYRLTVEKDDTFGDLARQVTSLAFPLVIKEMLTLPIACYQASRDGRSGYH